MFDHVHGNRKNNNKARCSQQLKCLEKICRYVNAYLHSQYHGTFASHVEYYTKKIPFLHNRIQNIIRGIICA